MAHEIVLIVAYDADLVPICVCFPWMCLGEAAAPFERLLKTSRDL